MTLTRTQVPKRPKRRCRDEGFCRWQLVAGLWLASRAVTRAQQGKSPTTDQPNQSWGWNLGDVMFGTPDVDQLLLFGWGAMAAKVTSFRDNNPYTLIILVRSLFVGAVHDHHSFTVTTNSFHATCFGYAHHGGNHFTTLDPGDRLHPQGLRLGQMGIGDPPPVDP